METRRIFPLIADDEVVISQSRQMQLYDNEELITNGGRSPQPREQQVSSPVREQAISKPMPPKVETSSAELARQEAKEDLRRKRQAIVSAEKKAPVKVPDLPASPKNFDKPKGLAKYSEKLRQSTYILADIKPIFQEPKRMVDDKPKKNNYDFLKRSQIYNQKENQAKKERQVAQELNLTRFDELE